MVQMPVKEGSAPIDPMPEGKIAVRTSDRGTFKKCRRQWDYASPMRQNYEPRELNENFIFGTAIHAALETYYDPNRAAYPRPSLIKAAESKFIEEMRIIKERDADHMLKKMSYDEYIDLGLGMLDNYFLWSVENDKNLTPVAVELDFEVTIGALVQTPETEFFIPYGGFSLDSQEDRQDWFEQIKINHSINAVLEVVYQGRIDIVWKDELTGRYYIGDHKTAGQLAETFYLSLDTQVSSYAWALTVLGWDIAGVIYNELLKNYPKSPASLKNGALSCDKRQITTVRIFVEELGMKYSEYLEKGTTGTAKYDEYLSWLADNEKQVIRRTPIDRNKRELAIQYEYIINEAKDMVGTPDIYPAPDKQVCNWCPFRGPCLAANEGGDPDIMLEFGAYDKRKPRHWR